MTLRWLLVSLALLGAIGCGGDPQGLEWGVRFASSADRDRALYVEAVILEGGCDGREVYRAEIPLDGAAPPAPPNLGPGVHGFAGRARDADCNWFVSGCIEATLPASAPVIVTLEADDAGSACPADECVDGRCDADDAGTPDAGPAVDAGMPDTGPPDTSVGDSAAGCAEGWLWDAPAMRCRDVRVDSRNCGEIDRKCNDDQHCVAGMCACRPYLTFVDGRCTDPSTDPTYCGASGRVCGLGGASEVTCRSGDCEDACRSTETNCNNHCVDVDNDPRHCGACDAACEVGRYCAAARCEEYRVVEDCGECGGGTCCPYGPHDTCNDDSACPAP